MRRFPLHWTSIFLLVASTAFGGQPKDPPKTIRDYGAVPNDGQDDTAAFQKAVQQGGTVRRDEPTMRRVAGRPADDEELLSIAGTSG